MSNTESKIKLIFEGAERGVGIAAAKAKLAIKSVSDENNKLEKAGAKAESALMGIGKGLLAVSSAGSAVSTIGAVAAAATQASGALLLLPGALAALKIGLGAIDMGAGDFLSAMGNLNDNKAFSKNMLAMGDSAKQVAADIKIAHDSLAEGLGEKMFAGIDAKLKPLIASTLPQLKASYDSIAVSVNHTGLSILDMLSKSDRQRDLNKLIQDSGGIWKQLLESVTPLAGAFLDIAVVGTDSLRKMSGGIGDAAKRFADFIAKARASGQIQRWIDGGVQAFKDLWHIVENVGSTIGSVFKGLGVSMGSPLAMLRDLTDRMAEFMKSASAQDGLRILGDGLRAIGAGVGVVAQVALSEIAKTLVALAPVAGTVAETLGTVLVVALRVLGPVIRGVADVLAAFPPVTVAATVALVGFVAATKTIKTVNAVTDLLGMESVFTRVGASAEASGAKVGTFGGKLGALKGAGAAAGAAVAIGAVAFAIDDLNVKAAGGAKNLDGIAVNLHQFRESIGGIVSGDFGFGQMVDQAKAAVMGIANAFAGLKLTPLKLDVDANGARAEADKLMSEINGASPVVNINGNNTGAGFALREILSEIAAGKESVTIDGQPVPAQDALARVKSLIDTSSGNVTIDGQTVPASRALDMILARVRSSSSDIQVGAQTGGAQGVIDGFIRRNDGRQIRIYTSVLGAGGIASAGRLATGGPVEGPGTGTSDTAGMFALSNGEYVATARQVDNAGGPQAFGRLMDALDKGRPTGLAAGGSVMRASAKAAMRTPGPASSAPGGGGTVVQFAGNTSDALATLIMRMIRENKIQLKAA